MFIAGLPGTGKTILSQQIAFADASVGKTSLYLSTLAEPNIKILRYLQEFTFFEPNLFGQRVIYGDLSSVLRKDGAAGMLERLDELVREHEPGIVVIDSFKALHDLIPDALAFREFVLELAVRLSAWEVTTLLVGEYSDVDVRGNSEIAIADGIIHLYGTEEAAQQRRYLRIMKLRGSAYFAGEHFFEIGSQGITVYPRMPPQVMGEYTFSDERAGSSIDGLSDMLGGGIFKATMTLIAGVSGSGKTLTALSFLMEGARQQEPGLLVSFEESPRQVARNALSFGWDVEDLVRRGLLAIFHVSPAELNIDRHAFDIKAQAEQIGAQRVAIDSATAMEAAVSQPSKYQDYMWAINDYFKRKGITSITTIEAASSIHPLEIGTQRISLISDNVILLRLVERSGEIKRTIAILKMRGSSHDTSVRELIIEPARIAVGQRLE
jgi:circadian clock protein KaiC